MHEWGEDTEAMKKHKRKHLSGPAILVSGQSFKNNSISCKNTGSLLKQTEELLRILGLEKTSLSLKNRGEKLVESSSYLYLVFKGELPWKI